MQRRSQIDMVGFDDKRGVDGVSLSDEPLPPQSIKAGKKKKKNQRCYSKDNLQSLVHKGDDNVLVPSW